MTRIRPVMLGDFALTGQRSVLKVICAGVGLGLGPRLLEEFNYFQNGAVYDFQQ